MLNQNPQTPNGNSMKELQRQVPKRVDRQGNPAQGPRLAQPQRPQLNPAVGPEQSRRAKEGISKWVVWAAGGGTVGLTGLATWFLT